MRFFASSRATTMKASACVRRLLFAESSLNARWRPFRLAMTQSQLENLLRNAGKVAPERDFFLIGSQALRGICRNIPRDFPKTIEADLYPRRYPQAWGMLREKLSLEGAK